MLRRWVPRARLRAEPARRRLRPIPTEFPDHYSDGAPDYARYRPRYPDTLYAYLAQLVHPRTLCWDCGTGNGQAAIALAEHFEQVVATDASAQQLQCAFPHPRVEYRHGLAEASSLSDASVDLVTAAASLHWMDLHAFYPEVRRVTRPGGVLAAWTYGAEIETGSAVDAVVDRYVEAILGPYWAPQLDHVHTHYQQLWFPFPRITPPPFAITASWTLDQLVGKLNTWSAAGTYRRHRHHAATDPVLEELTTAWREDGPPDAPRTVQLPLYLLLGRIR